jgi:tungstate transport system permease protein/tungstate transport system ATP-binding protein
MSWPEIGRIAAAISAWASATLSCRSLPDSGDGPREGAGACGMVGVWSLGWADSDFAGPAGVAAASPRWLCKFMHIARPVATRENAWLYSRPAADRPCMNTIADSLLLALNLITDRSAGNELWHIVALSLRVSFSACLLGAVVGLWLGVWLAVSRVPGHRVLVWLLNTLLALPSVVVGLLVYLLLSRSGPLGAFGLLFTPAAMVLAQSILVVPLIAALTRRLLLDALREGGDQLRSLGAGPLTSAWLMLLHERYALLTIALTAFGRAVAEVGAVMIVGGNILGSTRVMTTAIALETSKGDLPLALALGLVLLGVVGLVNLLITLVQSGSGGSALAREALA